MYSNDEFGFPVILPPENEALAKSTHEEIVVLVDNIIDKEYRLRSSYAKLGLLLLQVEQNKYWIPLNFKSFGEYQSSLAKKIRCSRSSLYNAVAVAKYLLPKISETAIEKMGITKANVLVNFIKQNPGRLTPKMVATAQDPDKSIQDLRKEVYKDGLPKEDGVDWHDLGGFYGTDEEWDEIRRAFATAALTDPPIPASYCDWQKKKEVMRRLAQEYLATYEAEVYGPES